MPPTTAWDETKKEESKPLAADASSSRPASAEGKKGKKEKDKKKGSGALPPPAAAPLSRRSSRADSEQSIDLMDRAAAGKVPRKPPPEAPAPPKANEEAYIPLALAKAKLAEYMCDLNLKHERLVEEIDETYSNINKETQVCRCATGECRAERATRRAVRSAAGGGAVCGARLRTRAGGRVQGVGSRNARGGRRRACGRSDAQCARMPRPLVQETHSV